MTMTPAEAARRLSEPANQVATVTEHPAGHIATLRDGRRMLITSTVARPYVPAVDDVDAAPDSDPTDEQPAVIDEQPANVPAVPVDEQPVTDPPPAQTSPVIVDVSELAEPEPAPAAKGRRSRPAVDGPVGETAA